ncbi:MAG: ABC transporter permease subunit [Candidatus Borkfalkiaceae bacterium]|nr:ABC transporter permease subunit [Clostridia bacterium]MDY6223843.1 ABC transporter permease subunit [Christensenellaceae bacterium]
MRINTVINPVLAGKTKKRKKWTGRNWAVFFMATLGLVVIVIFHYLPMAGLTLAFKDADYSSNLLGGLLFGEFVGFDFFLEFLRDVDFWNVMSNTLIVNLIMLLINFPAPIIFALILNEVKNSAFKKGVHVITTFPHFISWAIYGGIVIALTDQTTGIFNPILEFLGLSSAENPVYLMGADTIWAVIIISSVLKTVGWGSIIYMSAIASIDQEIYEAAELDGINRWQRAIYITLPCIAPTITVFLLLNIGRLLSNSFEQFNSMQNAVNLTRSEVLATYVYRLSFTARRYSYATAIGFFNSCISLLLLVLSNFISKKTAGRGLF